MSTESSLTTLPAEIFPLLASHLPLYSRPSSLSSLALTSHALYDFIQQLIYSSIILKNEDYALTFLGRLLENEKLGRFIREIHIMTDLSAATRNGEKPFDVVTGLQKVINTGLLSNIHTLTLHLLRGWSEDAQSRRLGHFSDDFFGKLCVNCPRLRVLGLRGLAEQEDEYWLTTSGIFELDKFKVSL